MKTFNIFFYVLLVSCWVTVINAQETNFPIKPYVDDEDLSMSQSSKSILKNKLSQIVMQNGFSTGTKNERFIITGKVIIVDKSTTSTAPALYSLNIDLPLCIGDGFEGIKFAQTNLSLKGIGASEEKAIIDALKDINLKDGSLTKFIEISKRKILDYYNNNCDVIIAEATSLESQKKYEEAIARLTEVPSSSSACYAKTLPILSNVYKKYIERDCKIKLNEAENAWASSTSVEAAINAANILSSIDPETNCYKSAKSLMTKIESTVFKKMSEIEKKEWELKFQKVKSENEANKELLNFAKQIALAQTMNQGKGGYKLAEWFR
jgi:predicted O-linked N-acetylglucosamine transferase (SPINDLY family)